MGTEKTSHGVGKAIASWRGEEWKQRRRGRKCWMIKIKQFSSEFNVLYSRENNPWVGGVQGLTKGGAPFLRDLRLEFHRALEAARRKQGMVG